METAFNARMRAAMANRMRPGKVSTPKGRGSRSGVGTTCTCARHAGWSFRCFRSSVMEPQDRLVTDIDQLVCLERRSLCSSGPDLPDLSVALLA